MFGTHTHINKDESRPEEGASMAVKGPTHQGARILS